MENFEKSIDFIINEINKSWDYISDRRSSVFSILKTYLLIFIVLSGYFVYIEKYVGEASIVFYSFLGLVLILVQVIIGVGMLILSSRTIKYTIINYKHIANMRYLYSTRIGDKEFKKLAINLIDSSTVSIPNTIYVVVLSSALNFLVLASGYYFWHKMKSFGIFFCSWHITYIIIVAISIFFQILTIFHHVKIINEAKRI